MSRTWIAILALLVGCGGDAADGEKGGWQEVEGVWAYEDPKEPTPLLGGEGVPGLDIKSVEIRTDGASLEITYTLTKNIEALLEAYHEMEEIFAGPLSVYLDTDANENTGGFLVVGDRVGTSMNGFDWIVRVYLSVLVDVVDGKREIAGFDGMYALDPLEDGQDWMGLKKRFGSESTEEEKREREDRINATRDYVQIDRAVLSVSISYGELGISSGDAVRILLTERHTKVLPHTVLPVVTVRVE